MKTLIHGGLIAANFLMLLLIPIAVVFALYGVAWTVGMILG